MVLRDLITTLVLYGVGGGLAAGSLAYFIGYSVRKAIDVFRGITNIR